MKRLRVAVCLDFHEERWPSMDRVAEMLVDQLQRNHADTIEVTAIVPKFARRATTLFPRHAGTAFSVDRVVNRLWDYPRSVAKIAGQYDVFHIIDHSYAQLVHRLPAAHTVVTCHDLDAFRSLLTPDDEPRSGPYNLMMRHVLHGLQRAARVTCDTAAVGGELIDQHLIPPERLAVAPIGVSAEFSACPDTDGDRSAARLMGSRTMAVDILHVGSTIERKRIDLLLKIVATLSAKIPDLRLIRVGGAFTAEQRRLAEGLGVAGRIVALDGIDDRTLSAVYRRATLLLLPSDREGFGLPIVEAMACGTPVVASDLDVTREVGGQAIEYCAAGAAPLWCERIDDLLSERRQAPERWTSRIDAGLARARDFSWARFASALAQVYREVA